MFILFVMIQVTFQHLVKLSKCPTLLNYKNFITFPNGLISLTDFITDKLSDALDELENYHTFDGKFCKYSRLRAEELLPADDWRLQEILKFRKKVSEEK